MIAISWQASRPCHAAGSGLCTHGEEHAGALGRAQTLCSLCVCIVTCNTKHKKKKPKSGRRTGGAANEEAKVEDQRGDRGAPGEHEKRKLRHDRGSDGCSERGWLVGWLAVRSADRVRGPDKRAHEVGLFSDVTAEALQ